MLSVVYYKDKKSLKKNSSFNWTYLGSYSGLEQVQSVLRKEKRIFIGKEIDNTIEKIRDNFVDYVGKLSNYQNNKVIWYASRLASKSVSQTSVFHQYVYLKLLEGLSAVYKDKFVIVTDDYEFLVNAGDCDFSDVSVVKFPRVRFLCIFKKIKDSLKILRYFLLWVVCNPLKNRRLKEFDIFIHSWVSDKVFANLPAYSDSNLGDLEGFLTKENNCVGRFMPVFLPLKYILLLKLNFSNIVFPLSYLKFSDFIKAVFTKFSITPCPAKELSIIQDVSILNMLSKNEGKKEFFSPYFFSYVLLYFSCRNLSEKIREQVVFVYPFENQPWEKMFNIAFSRFKRIGYQHSTIGSNWLDYRVSRFENQQAFLPSVILTVGKQWSIFLKKYFQVQDISEMGAIRYSHLFQEKAPKGKNNSKTVVMALPIYSSISLVLQKLLLEFIKRSDSKNYNFIIKPHPYLPRRFLLKDDFKDFGNCKFVESDIGFLLRDCALFISSSSSVVFESVLSGIKTMYFIPEEVSLGHEYFIRDQMFVAYEEDFISKLNDALVSANRPKLLIEEYFTRPGFDNLLKYLNWPTSLNNAVKQVLPPEVFDTKVSIIDK